MKGYFHLRHVPVGGADQLFVDKKDKSSADLRMYFYSKNTHCHIEKNAAVNS